MTNILISLFIFYNLLIFVVALKKSRKSFYSDKPFLFPLGIYVWGDALVLAPFWMVAGVIFLFLQPILILKFFIIFNIVRSFFEVIYWLNHQAVKSKYNPPIFRQIKWMNADQSAILYQLGHTCIVVFGIFALFVLN